MSGIFFVANDDQSMGFNGTASPFGSMRLYKPVKDIAPAQELNYYFADYYCINNDKKHYLLIGVAKKGTWEDHFCKIYLIKINIENNRFFTINKDGTAECSNKVWVYIFYMDDLIVSKDTYKQFHRKDTRHQHNQHNRKNKEYFAMVQMLTKVS